MNPWRLALPLIAGAAVLCAPARAQQPPTPPETEADAVRMLASDDYRERDEAMFWVLARARARSPIGAELRAAMLRAAEDSGWSEGRPKIDPEANPDGWGETWSFYAEAVGYMRDPAAIPFMLTRRGSAYDLAAIGRPALLPAVEAVEDPEADILHTVDLALRTLTLMVHDGLPTADELERIETAVRFRMETGMPGAAMSAFGLVVTLGAPELLAMIERAANDRDVAAAMVEGVSEVDSFINMVQNSARAALQPGFVPVVIRNRRR